MMQMMKNIIDPITRQNEANKITNKGLAEITAIITALAADDKDPTTGRRHLFRTENIRLKDLIKKQPQK